MIGGGHVTELPKLDKHEVPVTGGLVNWFLFLREADQTLGGVDGERTFAEKAMTTLEFLSQDAETRLEYEARLKFLRDETSRIEGVKAEAKAQGPAEGRAEGEYKKVVEIAANLLSMGLDIEAISKASGLSREEVTALKKI
ncbi:hypothetical protein WMW72_19925 [Paenibacillus filicis]|uniref:Transposase/invertase (TIGR01784 family) n=1 Tax=Paenibacillus filicis TaxID=669464 RepID=A0ABU9DMT7_9BACL